MQANLMGFFRDLPHGFPEQPSITDSIQEAPLPFEDKIVSYLASGHPVVATAGVVYDILDKSDEKVICSLKLLSDGSWVWPSDLAYYVAKYHVRLPEEFLDHVQQNQLKMPEKIHAEEIAQQLWQKI